MIKQHKYWSVLVVSLCCFALLSGTKLFAASAAKQLAKGIELYENNKSEEAMDYFVDVLLNGTQEEAAQANKYMNMIHDQLGGIQKPVEVDADFKEGEVKSLNQTANAAVTAAQEQARLAAEQAAAQAAAEEEAARAALAAKQQEAIDAVNAQQEALTQRIEAARQEALEQAQAQRQAALEQAAALADADLDAAAAVAATAQQLPQTAQEDLTAIETQAAQQVAAVRQAATISPEEAAASPVEQPVEQYVLAPSVLTEAEPAPVTTQEVTPSVFADLMSPEAIQARELYTRQKLDSMTAAAMENINGTKGVHLYMRDDRPDALDIEPEVIFEKGQFRTDSLPLLNSIYELLALTQGSAYVILPPGSYTDDVTLAGIRQAMALNSYLVNRGISQGKLHYNMGLADEEPPARYANLNGLAIVFDYDAKLPTNLEKNANNETAPLLSMAVVPLCHAIDRSLGEAFAIDFSVLETISPIDNWVLQIVQHGRDGKYYIVRQLEGFTPVYHQILWNGRKGIIGPELPCGKYTAVLTATDLKGQKQTVRRRLIVKCAGDATTDTCNACSTAKKAVVTTTDEGKLNYKASRLWVKPGRKMGTAAASATATSTDKAVSTASSSATKTVTTRTIIQEYDGTEDAESAVAPVPPVSTSSSTSYEMEEVADAYPTNNPYDMPYEEN